MRLRLDSDMAEAVLAYHQSLANLGMDGSVTDTIRSLIQMGLSSAPADAAEIAACRRAFNQVQSWTVNRVRKAFDGIRLELMGGGFELNGPKEE
jgi:hypothetical protein